MAEIIMKKKCTLFILTACVFLFSCIENPNSIGEEQKPVVKTEKADKLISVYVHIVKNIDYLNILRQGVRTGKKPIEYGEIENIAEIIPRKSIAQSVLFSDKHFSMEWERYRYRIRYRSNGAYKFSQWSDAVSVASVWNDVPPDGLNYITENANVINMAYRDNGKLTIKEIQEKYMPNENSSTGTPFFMSQFQSAFDNINIDKEAYTEGYAPCLAFSYNDGESKSEKVSRIFDIGSLVFKEEGDETEYYLAPYIAADYNISTVVSSDFFNKDVLLEGFIGEKITDKDEDNYKTIEWTSLSPVCLYEPKTDGTMGETEAYYKYEKMPVDKETGYSIIKIKSSSQSDNNHDYSNYEGVEGNGRALNKNNEYFYRDFSTFCED